MSYDYDLVVIGGGAAGLVASKFAAGIGKRVALIEKNRLGGECTLYGCVPSKTLIRAARAFHGISEARKLGLVDARQYQTPVTMPAKNDVMAHVRSVVEAVYDGHNPELLERLGIQVMIGHPRFRDKHHVYVNGRLLSSGTFVVCTGSSPFVPSIEGIDSVPYLTNQTLFGIDRLPQSMIVLGGGPIGIEMAQAFNYLGVRVTVVEMAEQILMKDDREFSDILAGRLRQQGLVLLVSTKAVSVEGKDGSIILIVQEAGGRRYSISAETILVAVGRKANVEGIDLEAAGVVYSPKSIKTDVKLRTTVRNIFACGDVTGPYQFSHMAEYQARIAARNALLPFQTRALYEHYLWCTFTDPEFAHAGLTEDEARQRYGNKIRVYRWQYRQTDRARTEAEEFGVAKFICDPSYKLIGAHILGNRAGELIHEAQIIKTLGIPFYKLDSVIHVYPTFSDVVRQPAKMSRIDRLRNNLFIRIAGTLTGKKK